MNKITIFLISVLLLILTMASISAQDNQDTLDSFAEFDLDKNIYDDCKLSTSENSDVVSVSSNNGDYVDYKLLEDASGSESSDTASSSSKTHTFSDLKETLDNAASGSTVLLSGTYKYNKKTDSALKEGVKIPKSLKLIGVDSCIIDGAGAARCLRTEKSCTITLQNLIIQNAYVNQLSGGALLVGEKTKLTIKNCTFQNNKAVNNNKKKYYANGGAMSIQPKAKVYIHDSKFINNYVKNGNGGAIALQENSYVEVHKSVFNKNVAERVSSLSWNSFKRGMGAAIKTSIGCTVKLYDSSFKSNKAYDTIVLVVTESTNGKKLSTLYVKNCNFESNKVHKDGVIYLDEFGKGTILNSKFIKNKSPYGSGTVIFDVAKKGSKIKNCLFESNTVDIGGGLCIRVLDKNSKYKSYVNIVNCNFTKNIAKRFGGAIFTQYGVIKVNNCKFTSNVAKKTHGGAIFFKFGKLTVTKSKFIKNKAPYGGAIAYSTKNAKFSKNKFSNNVANNKKNSKIYKF